MMNLIARYLGVFLVVDRTMKIMFGRSTLADPALAADRRAWRAALLANRRRIWRAVNGVIERQGVADELSSIKAPTLVLVGAEDVATSPTKAEAIHAAIEGSRLVCIPPAAIPLRGNRQRSSMQLWRSSLRHNRGNADPIRIGNSQFMMMSVKPSRAQQKNYFNIRLEQTH